MLKNVFGSLSKDLGIDIGTTNTIVYVEEKGIVIDEPSVVAINTKNDQILAVGHAANEMVGKTPPHITAAKPIVDGVVSDFEVAEKMLKHFIEQVHKETFSLIPRPQVVIGIPLDVTEVERKAVEDAATNAGARKVHLIHQSLAAAVGARIQIYDSAGSLVIDIGGGTTEISVISLGGIVTWRSMRLGGEELNRNIINYVRDHFNVLLGDRTAEEVKKSIGSAHRDDEILEAQVRGRDLISGLPREITLNSSHLREAMGRSINQIVDNIKLAVEHTPPELIADVYDQGIVLCGGTTLLRGIDKRIEEQVAIPTRVADDPLTVVARGIGVILEDIEKYKELFLQGHNDLT